MSDTKIVQVVLFCLAARAVDKKYVETTSLTELLVQLQNNFTEMFLIKMFHKKYLAKIWLPEL